ncbi:cbb3-type cytochrome oxidase assembly protein CcoS [Prosthecochloris sp. SCSIO W1103]|uniref:cbb3-type cytochrome oxidase assembly protein CcoS n=1 Tax=Prosthecochloris sp. SCSIO W1103 TaxID=2992244 RepID=UPI00223DFC12|nr:cbb3-type cytochrome oxidase assembly protein CcoS [Prosthecochloris sp. SCSIO W1103]UZJ38498.1 cbb3-type cytochrome oxidase assembly protein CcoS [Prosthecochloris sp. SCSIO W1103]
MYTTYFLIFIVFFLGFAAWLLFVWAVKSGQFEDPEAPKYRMLDDEDASGAIENSSSAQDDEKPYSR